MEVTKENWKNLLNYYILCLTKVNDSSITFLESAKNKKYFSKFKEESLFSTESNKAIIWIGENSSLSDFIKKNIISFGVFNYGYPLFRVQKNSNFGSYSEVSPILFSEVKVEVQGDNLLLELLDKIPNINESIFKAANITSQEIDEFTQNMSQNMIEENVKGDINNWLQVTINNIQEITKFKLFSTLNFKQLDDSYPGLNDQNSYILNNSIIFHTDTQQFNSACIRELELLKRDIYYNKIKDTALYPILTQNYRGSKNIGDKKILLISDSNGPQRDAVKSSLENDLTVVSGPPGTGKSQVVLNLVSSIYANNLFGILISKNNTAVNVITDNYYENFDIPIILRTGNKQYKENAIEKIDIIANGYYKTDIKKEELEIANKEYIQKYNDLFEEDIRNRKRYELLDELAELTDKFEKLKQNLSMQIINWALAQTYDIFICNQYLDKISEYINWANDLINNQSSGIIIKYLNKFINFVFGRTKKDLINNINSFSNNIHSQYFFSESDSLLNIKEYCINIKNVLTLSIIKKKVEKISEELRKMPVIEKRIEDYENDLQLVLNLGRKYLIKIREYILSSFKYDDILKLKEFVDVEKQLLNFTNGAYKILKSKENELFPYIKNCFSFWASTSLSAKNAMFPLEPGIFDLVIIDEASQCDIASVIPMLFRAKKACIIGDLNQFAHIVPFDKEKDLLFARNNNISDSDFIDFSYKERSIYSVAERAMKTETSLIKLDEHYRSHPDIIKFSNDQFYGRLLKIMTNPKTLVLDSGEQGIEWCDIKGSVTHLPKGSAYNRKEAEYTCELALKLMKKYFITEKYVSIGIVTPLRAQAELIKEIFSKLSNDLNEEDKNIYEAYTNYKIPFYIDTAYKFQGNERDIIILSTVASTGIRPSTYNFINERRQLNVAITRAKSKLFVVGDKSYCLSNKSILGDLAIYTNELLNNTKTLKYENKKPESYIEQQLYDRLCQEGFEPKCQYPVAGFYLDFAIIVNDQKIGIECDGLSTHRTSDGSRRKTDLARLSKLKNEGWKILQFWSWDILQELDKCIDKIKKVIQMSVTNN